MGASTCLTICHGAILIGAILAALGAYGTYHFSQRVAQEKEGRQANVGILSPETSVLNRRTVGFEKPVIEFGDSGARLKWNGAAGTALFQFMEDTSLEIERVNDRVLVSISIRDSSGKLVAEILKNEWKVNPDDSWDRNYTKDTLEVRDSAGEIVLQIRVLPGKIQFQAKMYDSSGRGMYWGKLVGPNGKVGGGWEFTGKNHPKLTSRIAPLFRYPSQLHMGEYADPETEAADGG